MDPTRELIRRSRVLAAIVLLGTVVLLVLLLAVPVFVPHESMPAPLLVFWGLFILIVALILGISAAYVFLTRARVQAAPSSPATLALEERPAGGAAPAPDTDELAGLAVRLLDGDERRLFREIVAARGPILQRDLVRATSFSDAKVSRLLDRLEQRSLVVRERHGMTNRIRLVLGGR